MALPILVNLSNDSGEKIDLLQASLKKQEDNDFTNKDSDFMQIQFKMYDSLINIFEIQKDIFKFMVGQDRKEKIKKDTESDKGNLKDTASGVGKGSMFDAIKNGFGKQEGLIPKLLGGLFEGIKHVLLLGVILFKEKILKLFSGFLSKTAIGKVLGALLKGALFTIKFALSKFFTLILGIPLMIYGFVDEFMKSGDLSKAFGAAIGQFIDFFTAGLIDKETVKTWLSDAGDVLELAVHDFFAQIGDWFNNLTKYLLKELPRLASWLGIRTPEEKLRDTTKSISDTKNKIAGLEGKALEDKIAERGDVANERNEDQKKRAEKKARAAYAAEKLGYEKQLEKLESNADNLKKETNDTSGTSVVATSNIDRSQKPSSTGVGKNNKVDGYGDDVTADIMESYIRESAMRNNIDPDVAVRVWQSEGQMTYQSNLGAGDANANTVGGREASYGPFQLYTGRNGRGGLGNVFEEQYGKKLAESNDLESVKQQIDFAMKSASTSETGWFDWKGARDVGIGDKEGIGVNRPQLLPSISNPPPENALKLEPKTGQALALTSSEVKQKERSSQSPTVIGGATNNNTVVNNVSSGGSSSNKGNVPPRSINNPAAHVSRNYTLGINR